MTLSVSWSRSSPQLSEGERLDACVRWQQSCYILRFVGRYNESPQDHTSFLDICYMYNVKCIISYLICCRVMPTVWMSTSSNAKRYVRCFRSLYPSLDFRFNVCFVISPWSFGVCRERICGMMYLRTLLFCVSGLISRLERSSAVQRLSWPNSFRASLRTRFRYITHLYTLTNC